MDTTADRITVWMLFVLIIIATVFLANEGGMEALSHDARMDQFEVQLNERLPPISGKYLDVKIFYGVEGGEK